MKPKDTIFLGQYLFTGSESTSVWLEVSLHRHACHTSFIPPLTLSLFFGSGVGKRLTLNSVIVSLNEQVVEVQNMDVKCVIKNSATLTGALFTAHAVQVPVTLPTLSESDKKV